MNASVLARPYQKPEDQTYEPTGPAMNNPMAFGVGAQQNAAPFMPSQPRTVVPPTELPAGVQYRAPAPAQVAPSPAQSLAGRPQQAAPEQRIPKGWTKERMDEADLLNQMGRAHTERVEGRRAKRKDLSKYESLKGQLDTQASSLKDLRELKQSFGKDDPHALAIQRKIMERLIAAERLHGELGKHAQSLSKKYQLPLGKDGFLEDYNGNLAADDTAYDDETVNAIADLAERRPAD